MLIDKTIAIAALARDCEQALRRNIPKIEKLRSYFKSSAVVVVENDSKDGTKSALFEWEKSVANIKILSQDFNTRTIPAKTAECQNPGMSRARIEKMCAYRNIYMNYLQNSGVDYDYLLVIDVDIDDFSVEGVIDAVHNAPDGWTALFANGVWYLPFMNIKIPLEYYDGYALILPSGDGKIETALTIREMQESVGGVSKMLKHNDFCGCVCAHGGISLYHYSLVKASRYYSIPNTRSSIAEVLSEHVPLNYSLYQEKPGTLYIAKKMRVYYQKVSSIKDIFIYALPVSIRIFLYELIKRKKFPV